MSGAAQRDALERARVGLDMLALTVDTTGRRADEVRAEAFRLLGELPPVFPLHPYPGVVRGDDGDGDAGSDQEAPDAVPDFDRDPSAVVVVPFGPRGRRGS